MNHFEQAPNRESRITLSRDRDALGLNRLQVDLRITDQDRQSMVRIQRILKGHFQRHQVGQFQMEIFDAHHGWETLTDSSHHMGTTRMNDNPRQGVVARNCKVHGLENLDVSSSSVCPTVGHANPTLTILALTLRLCDHLKTEAIPHLSTPTQVSNPLETMYAS